MKIKIWLKPLEDNPPDWKLLFLTDLNIFLQEQALEDFSVTVMEINPIIEKEAKDC